jgi:cytochrome P450
VSVTSVFDPWAPEVQADPYPYYRRLRDESPCARLAAEDAWVLSRYEDVRTAARDYRRFSVTEGLGVRRDHMGGNILVQVDPPAHTKSRRAVQPIFLPKTIVSWEERAEVVADELIAAMLEAGTVDFKNEVAMPLVTTITAEMMGLPDDPEMRSRYALWSRRIMEDLDRREGDSDLVDLHGTIAEAQEWFSSHISARDRESRDRPADMIDALMATGGSAHSDDQVTQLALTLLAAGVANTADMMCHALLAMHEFPDQWTLFRKEPDKLAANVVEESVRYGSPAHCVYRLVLEDVDVDGVTLPQGSRVMVLFGSANHDERAFDDPDRFDVMRDRRPGHLGWGAGVHRCLGEPIGQLEGVALIGAMGRAVANFDLDGPVEAYTTTAVRGFDRLPVRARGV